MTCSSPPRLGYTRERELARHQRQKRTGAGTTGRAGHASGRQRGTRFRRRRRSGVLDCKTCPRPDPGFREFSKGGKQEWGGRRVSYRQAARSSLPTPDPFSSDPWATLAGISAETTISHFRNREKVNMWGEEVSVTSGLAHPDPQRPLAGRMSPEDPYPMLARTRRGRVAFGCSRWGHGDSTRRACRGPSRVTTQAFSTSRPRSASPPTPPPSTIPPPPAASTSAA